MRLLLLISLATLPLAGCRFFGGDKPVADLIETIEQDDSLGAAPTIPTVPDGGAANPDSASPKAFEEPTVVAAQPTAASADLIQSTDPAARTRQISRSRVDPFASLPIPPAPTPIVVSPTSVVGNGSASGASNGASSGASSASNGSGASSASNGSSGASSASNGSAAASARASGGSASGSGRSAAARVPIRPAVRVQPNNAPLVVPSPIAVLPRIPQPVIAPTVLVSGVVQLDSESYAIVRAGNEPERYVRVGDRIAGGSVRVKRIETLAFEPRVILEENGIEVARPVESGDTSAPAAEQPADSAAAAPSVLPPVASARPYSFLSSSSLTHYQSSVLPNFRVNVPAV